MKTPLILFSILLSTTLSIGQTFNVLDYGAIGDGIKKDTRALQKAIDACTEAGGGTVVLPAGKTFLTGTLYMRNFVTLHISNGAVLLGSTDISDYATDTHKQMYRRETHMDRCLIFARDAHSFGFSGQGIIDGNGHQEHFPRGKSRPMLFRFLNCQNIQMRDIQIKHPASWASAWLYCDNVVVDGIDIQSRVNFNGDGLDFDGCTNVRVANSAFNTSDDSICLQASDPDKPCKNIVVTNCIFESKWAGMRIGLLSRGDFESVTVSNCTFNNIDDSGLKIQMNEGGTMQHMVFSNLVMKNVPRPIFMTFCQQRAAADAPMEMAPMQQMKHFVFSNIIIDNSALDKNSAIFITGFPGHPIENILLDNIQFITSGEGTAEDAARTDLPEYTLEVLKGHWPEFKLVGTLPAAFIYLRHVRGVHLSAIQLFSETTDARPPIGLQNVEHYSAAAVFHNYKKVN